MRTYPIPQSDEVLQAVRDEIQRDFEAMAEKYALPSSLSFVAVRKAVSVGMVPVASYPFRKLQVDLIDTLGRHAVSNDDMNEVLSIMSAVWNYFPHTDMGTSPVEKMRAQMPERQEPPDMEALAEIMTEGIDTMIPLFSKTMRGVLAIHMNNFGFRDQDVDIIADMLERPTTDPSEALTYILKEAIALAKKNPRKIYTMAYLQPVVRALAGYENHAASRMINGHYNSRMFQNIARQHVESMAIMLEDGESDEAIELLNPAAYLDAHIETHRCIAMEGKKMGADMKLQEAAHHILDWIGLIDIEELMRYDPRSFARVILAVAHRISKTGYPEGTLGCSEKKIRSLLRKVFPDGAEYEKEILRIAELALCGCADPELMIADVVNSPEDNAEKLSALASCLKLRSPVNPLDLPFPSPPSPFSP